MGNTKSHNNVTSTAKKFELNERKKVLLVNGFCRPIFQQLLDYRQYNLCSITSIVVNHYDYMINERIQSLFKKLLNSKHTKQSEKGVNDDDYMYLSISLLISQMLMQYHQTITRFFVSTLITSTNTKTDHKTTQEALTKEKVLLYKSMNDVSLNNNISRVVFNECTSASYRKICPSRTIDNYVFKIRGDKYGIYNGIYKRCFDLNGLSISDNGEVSLISRSHKNYNKFKFNHSRFNIWIHNNDTIKSQKTLGSVHANKSLKYIRCLYREKFTTYHCFWRLSCIRINNSSSLLPVNIPECYINDNNKKCISYLCIVNNYTTNERGDKSLSDILPQYYEYPSSTHSVWKRIEGAFYLNAHLSLCYNEFCDTLPSLSSLGSNSNTIRCKLIKSDSQIYWNDKFIKSTKKNLNYNNNKSESKLLYYYIWIWLKEILYKISLDRGYNFKNLNKNCILPCYYYNLDWNILGNLLQKNVLKGRIKYYGKDIYFKNINSTSNKNIKIADDVYIIDTINKLLICLQSKLQNQNNKKWYQDLNKINLAPQYNLFKHKLLKK